MDIIRYGIWMLVGLVTLWFLGTLTSRYFFYYTNINQTFQGNIAIQDTDIGTECGLDALKNNETVDYKLSSSNQIIYLCPSKWWPIEKRVTAKTITDHFRKSLPPNQSDLINKYYPIPQKQTPLIPLP